VQKTIVSLLVGAISLVQPWGLRAEAPKAQETEAHRLAQQLQLARGGTDIINQTFDALRTRLIQVIMQRGHTTEDKAASVCDDILMPAMKTHSKELNDSIAGIYASNFTPDELRDLITFYQSRTGRKLVAKLPLTTAESNAAGRAWGERVARQAIAEHLNEFRQRGITL
jgi:hypothetical protein